MKIEIDLVDDVDLNDVTELFDSLDECIDKKYKYLIRDIKVRPNLKL